LGSAKRIIEHRPFKSLPIGFNSALDIWASPVPNPNDHDNRQKAEAKIKGKKRVMSQDSKQRQYTEDRTTSCSQDGHTRFRLVHLLHILSCTHG